MPRFIYRPIRIAVGHNGGSGPAAQESAAIRLRRISIISILMYYHELFTIANDRTLLPRHVQCGSGDDTGRLQAARRGTAKASFRGLKPYLTDVGGP